MVWYWQKGKGPNLRFTQEIKQDSKIEKGKDGCQKSPRFLLMLSQQKNAREEPVCRLVSSFLALSPALDGKMI